MKNKKGFTLVEIIVCLVLIIMVGTISIIMFNKDEKEPEDELKSLVTESASVKYLSSAIEMQEIQETYGYKVYKVQELIDKGILEENKFKSLLSNIKTNEGEDYSKIVLKYDYSNVGEIEYRYPYVVNDDIFLENKFGDIVFVKDNGSFECKEGITKLSYLDENYEKKDIIGINDINNTNLRCKISESNDIIENISYDNDTVAGIFNNYDTDLSLNSGKHYINYVLEVDGRYYQTYMNRKVTVISPNDNFFIGIKDDNGNIIENFEQWYTGTLNAYIYNDVLEFDSDLFQNLSGEWEINDIIPSNDFPLIINDEINSGEIKIAAKLILGDYEKPLEAKTVKIDNGDPEIKKLLINRKEKTITVEAEDLYAGLKSVGLYKNGQEHPISEITDIDKRSMEHIFDNISINELDNYNVKITDNVGNVTEKHLNNVPYFDIKAIDNSIFDFYIEVDNIKSLNIDFDIPKISTSNTEYWHYLNNNLDASYSSNTEDGLNGRYDFSFRTIADKIIRWYDNYYDRYNNTRVSPSILNNLTLDVNISMIDLKGEEIDYEYEIKLNAYHDSGYFGGKFYNYSGWWSYLYAFNDDSDIIFELYNRGSNKTLYLKEKGESLDSLLTVYTGVDDYGPKLQSFDSNTIKYGYYNLTDRYGYDWWGDWGVIGTTTTNYIYNYNLNTNTSSRTTNTNSSYWDNNTGTTLPASYINGTWPKITSKSYYYSLKDYLSKYKDLEYVSTTNPDILGLYDGFDYSIFNQDDGWKSVLSYDRFGDRIDYTMYFYKEEVSITQK